MGALYTNLVNVCTTDELIAEGFLVPLQMYAARAVDMTGAKVVAGEWTDKEVEKRGMEIIGDIVAEWIDKTRLHFGGPVKTIVFSATVEHGHEICRLFNEQGYNFQQVSYKDGNPERRKELIDEFKRPDSSIDGLVSCEVFTKGFDCSDVLCGIAARPYRKSLSSHIQQLGRVMRPSPGKTLGLWLDHCGNVLRFDTDTKRIFAQGLRSLDDSELDRKTRNDVGDSEKKELACSCGFVLPFGSQTCPACGKERERRSLVENVAGVMEAVGDVVAPAKNTPEYLRDKQAVWRQLSYLAIERKPKDPAAAKKFALAQFMNLFGHWPKWEFGTENLEQPSSALKGKVQSMMIARAHKMARGTGNRCQIVQDTFNVSSTQEAVKKAGPKEIARLSAKKAVELKKDIEASALINGTSVVGSTTVARTMRGVKGWCATNFSGGTGSAAPVPSTNTAPVAGTNRPYAEPLLKDILRKCYEAGGNVSQIHVRPSDKQIQSGFAGNATRMQSVDGTGKSAMLQTAYAVYASDFGNVSVIPNRVMSAVSDNAVYAIDTSMWALATLRPFNKEELAKVGDARNFQITWEGTLEARNEASSGQIRDLS